MQYIVSGVIVLLLVLGGWWWHQQSSQEGVVQVAATETVSEVSGVSEIVTEDQLEYFTEARGFYAAPATPGQYPGVVMIHENRGLRPEIKQEAEALAREGYRVLAVDLYKGVVMETQEEARAYGSQFNQQEGLTNLQAAVSYLQQRGSAKIASLGWCFGGRQSLELAMSGIPLDATVVYYGGGMATSTEQLAPITWPVLGVFGDQDQIIPTAMVRDFETSLETLGIEHEVYIYEGVGHAFANPSNPNFAPEPTADAWNKTLNFFATHLQ